PICCDFRDRRLPIVSRRRRRSLNPDPAVGSLASGWNLGGIGGHRACGRLARTDPNWRPDARRNDRRRGALSCLAATGAADDVQLRACKDQRMTWLVDQSTLDPELQHFVDEMRARWAQHPPFASLTFPEQRAVCEQV